MLASRSVIGNQRTRFRQLIQLFGLPQDAVRFVQFESWDQLASGVDYVDQKPLVVEIAAGTHAPSPQAWLENAQAGAARRDIFLFGPGFSGSCESRSDALKANRGDLPSLSEIRFSDDALWGPLQGMRANWPVFTESSTKPVLEPSVSWRPLITIADEPWFFRGMGDRTRQFVWAAAHLPDIAEAVKSTDEQQGGRLLGLLPLLVFLRHAFGKRIWHVPKCFANFIIDDPPVRDQYGFFSPARHVASLAGIPHATTIGFIPWNWNRSTPAAAKLFRSHSSELSLCIHGCDHTGGEFASLNQATLSAKCRLALQRAELLRQRTGLLCEPVMVFPQGLFSRAAVAALRENNFLAAVNSTLFPVDVRASEVRLADLIEPVFSSIEDFPIFLRRYPRDPVLGAVDLFLGRPLLVVEHHEYFRDGYAECRRFHEEINRFGSRPTWAPLDQIVRRACLQREIEPGKLDVRFYTDSFIVENSSAQRLSYRLARRCTRSDFIRGVIVNGMLVDHAFDEGQLVFSFELAPQTAAAVQVVQNGLQTNQVFKGSLPYRVRVWARRSLCNLRDNQALISKCALWIKRARNRPGHSV